jgi:hypothetical protein
MTKGVVDVFDVIEVEDMGCNDLAALRARTRLTVTPPDMPQPVDKCRGKCWPCPLQ